jgi:lipopolysaccharide export system protein LptA
MTSKRSNISQLIAKAGLALMVVIGGVAVSGQAGAANGFTNHDPDDPIRFTADRLEVKREGRVAAFIGNVEAYQGDMKLSADVVKVYYQSAEDDEETSDTGIAGFGGSVSRIDTSGNVKVESRGDVATGDWAVYDINRKIVTLGGDVELQRDDTVLQGSRLELDLENGRSTIQSSDTMDGSGRVRGEFTPTTSSN